MALKNQVRRAVVIPLVVLIPVLSMVAEPPAPSSPPVPSLGAIRPFPLQPAPDCVDGVAAMGERLWVLDGGTAQVLAYGEDGKPFKAGGKALPPLRVNDPSRLAASCRLAAVVEEGHRVRFLSGGGGRKSLLLPSEWLPSVGLQMTSERLFLTYTAWMGPGPEGSKGGREAVLLSTDLNGSDVRVYETLPAGSDGAKAAGLWNAYSSWAEWQGHGWVLARTLPLRLYLFSADGRLLKRFPEGDLPPPPAPNGSKDRTLELLAMDRVIGLVPEGDFLGVVWQRRAGPEPMVHVDWLDEQWRKAGEQEVRFPERLTLHDNLLVSTTLPGKAALLLLFHGKNYYSVTSEVFVWPFVKAPQAPAGRTGRVPPLPNR